MRRRLFNVLAVLSLVLCVATVALWVRSCWRQDTVAIGRWAISSGRGLLALSRWDKSWHDDGRAHWESDPDLESFHRPPLVRFDSRRSVATGLRTHTFWLPLWLPAALGAVSFCFAWRRSVRPSVGHCLRCGYDLRATPDRCPECGAMRHVPAQLE